MDAPLARKLQNEVLQHIWLASLRTPRVPAKFMLAEADEFPRQLPNTRDIIRLENHSTKIPPFRSDDVNAAAARRAGRELRMIKICCAALLGIAGVFAATASSATPLTFYYDQAAWLAAVQGLQIEMYSSESTETDQLRTAEYPGPIVTTSIVTTSTLNGGLSSVGPIDFSYSSCSSCTETRLTDITISLGSPIQGFAGNLNIFDSLGTITLNQELVIAAPEYNGFFGVVGFVSSVDFNYSGGITDSPELLSLSNIQVLAVDEPPSLLMGLSAGLVLLLLAGTQKFRCSGSDTQPVRWA